MSKHILFTICFVLFMSGFAWADSTGGKVSDDSDKYDINTHGGKIDTSGGDIDSGDIDSGDIDSGDIDSGDIDSHDINSHDINSWVINANEVEVRDKTPNNPSVLTSRYYVDKEDSLLENAINSNKNDIDSNSNAIVDLANDLQGQISNIKANYATKPWVKRYVENNAGSEVEANVRTCSGSGHSVAKCTVKCNSNEIVVGGGCEVRNPSNNWNTAASVPKSNGWYCQGNEDFGAETYNYTVYGYVICVKK